MLNASEPSTSFLYPKCHLLSLTLCGLSLLLLCQLGAQSAEGDNAKMPPFPQSAVRRHYHHPNNGAGARPHPPPPPQHNNFRDEPMNAGGLAAAASPIHHPHQQQQQQSFAVNVPQAPPVAFDYGGGAKLPAAAPSTYNSGSDSQMPSADNSEIGANGQQPQRKNVGTQIVAITNAQAQQQNVAPHNNSLAQRRAKRRCPREALIIMQNTRGTLWRGNGGGATMRRRARMASHRVSGQTATKYTEFASGPAQSVAGGGGGARLYAAPQHVTANQIPYADQPAAAQYGARTRLAAQQSKALAGTEYDSAPAAEALPPAPKALPRARTKTARPAAAPSAAGRSSSSNKGNYIWAYIKKPLQKKKQGGGNAARPGAAPAPVQAVPAVTPAPSGGTAIGGVGKYFTALPPGAKGIYHQTIDSKNLPTVNEAHHYYYPPRMPLPLPTCFHNPTGYPCCNPTLNDIMVETYTDLESKPKFHTCNINAIAQHMQVRAEERFNTSFETVAAFDDFAQKVHFYGDLVCKVELGGKYMLAYATVKDVDQVLSKEQSQAETTNQQEQQSNMVGSSPSRSSGSASYPARLIRQKRENSGAVIAPFVGPLLPPVAVAMPTNEFSTGGRHAMWI